MKWAMKQGMGISRGAAVWLIRSRIDDKPEFFFFPADRLFGEAKRIGARTIHAKGGDFFGHDGHDTVQVLLDHFGLTGTDPALDLWGEMVRDAEGPVKQGLPAHPESFGIHALVQGYKVALPEDARRIEILPLQFQALYEWCRKVVAGDIKPPRVSPHGPAKAGAPNVGKT
jgi:hypothetical protein